MTYLTANRLDSQIITDGSLDTEQPCGVPTCEGTGYRFVPVGRLQRDEDGTPWRHVVWLCDGHMEPAEAHLRQQERFDRRQQVREDLPCCSNYRRLEGGGEVHGAHCPSQVW